MPTPAFVLLFLAIASAHSQNLQPLVPRVDNYSSSQRNNPTLNTPNSNTQTQSSNDWQMDNTSQNVFTSFLTGTINYSTDDIKKQRELGEVKHGWTTSEEDSDGNKKETFHRNTQKGEEYARAEENRQRNVDKNSVKSEVESSRSSRLNNYNAQYGTEREKINIAAEWDNYSEVNKTLTAAGAPPTSNLREATTALTNAKALSLSNPSTSGGSRNRNNQLQEATLTAGDTMSGKRMTNPNGRTENAAFAASALAQNQKTSKNLGQEGIKLIQKNSLKAGSEMASAQNIKLLKEIKQQQPKSLSELQNKRAFYSDSNPNSWDSNQNNSLDTNEVDNQIAKRDPTFQETALFSSSMTKTLSLADKLIVAQALQEQYKEKDYATSGSDSRRYSSLKNSDGTQRSYDIEGIQKQIDDREAIKTQRGVEAQ